jgi:hypothetical protein
MYPHPLIHCVSKGDGVSVHGPPTGYMGVYPHLICTCDCMQCIIIYYYYNYIIQVKVDARPTTSAEVT